MDPGLLLYSMLMDSQAETLRLCERQPRYRGLRGGKVLTETDMELGGTRLRPELVTIIPGMV